MKKCNNLSILLKGILLENPVFVLVLGTCPTLAITKSVTSAIGMGLAATAVLICSNMVISLLRKVIPDSVRIPSYIVVIASFVTLVQMLIHAFVPTLYEMLGVFLPLITVNCIILGRAEMFANKNSVGKSALDGLSMGIGFTLALLSISIIREVLGAGAFAGVEIPFMADYKINFLVEAPGGFLVYGMMIALVYKLTHGKAPYKKEFSCENCPSAAFCNKAAQHAKEEN
ncbi:MAG: electron transport complex subunit E [Clostridia bacterium]|nr:electron transport complex subunit E [Clostridia bacterium]MBR6741418.1 electron transport complex subunit E [Clostridia bacterium]